MPSGASMCAARASQSRGPGINPARRAFLTGSVSGLNPRAACLPAKRIALLKQIALRWEHGLPAGKNPELRATDACLGHGVCASVCPTGALRLFEESGFRGLEFDSVGCFACGACVAVCPEQALRLEPRHPGLPQPVPEHITRHALAVCSRCDAEFKASANEEFCPVCRKEVGLFTHGFSARSNES